MYKWQHRRRKCAIQTRLLDLLRSGCGASSPPLRSALDDFELESELLLSIAPMPLIHSEFGPSGQGSDLFASIKYQILSGWDPYGLMNWAAQSLRGTVIREHWCRWMQIARTVRDQGGKILRLFYTEGLIQIVWHNTAYALCLLCCWMMLLFCCLLRCCTQRRLKFYFPKFIISAILWTM